MKEILFSIGPIKIYSYGFMIAIGVISAILLASYRMKKRNMNNDVIYSIAIIALIFGFIGSKLLYILVEFKQFLYDPWGAISGNGFVIYGGIIGGVASAMVYCKIKKLDFMEYFDLCVPSVSLAQGFGRIGCFMAGCCYGRPTDSFLGITFHNSSFAPNGVPLLPTQLFSAAGDFLITAVVLLYSKRSPEKGKVSGLYLILYSIGRFIIEFFRNDYRGTIWIFSTSQFISIFILIAGIALFFNVGGLIKRKDRA